MASFTASSQIDAIYAAIDAANHSVDSTYLGGGFTDSVGGLQPTALVAEGAWNGPAAGRAAFDGETAAFVGGGSHTLDDGTYLGGGFTDSVGGIVPEAAALSGWDGPVVTRPGPVSPGGAASVTADSHDLSGATKTYIGPGFTEQGYGIQPDNGYGLGGIIPTSYFHRATGYVANEDGERITNAVYFIARGDMSVASTVNDSGEFAVYLLNQKYDEFYLVVESQETNKEIMWYETTEQDVAINPGDENVEIRFQEDDVELPEEPKHRGLMIGRGVVMN